ncbi:hypothetical protein Q3G72_025675 [Acer saccharum]|nr:hypothetical protein Q3G72_025675 [Acer saccharum]
MASILADEEDVEVDNGFLLMLVGEVNGERLAGQATRRRNRSHSLELDGELYDERNCFTPPAAESLRSSKMPFKRYVEIGRVALVNYGKDYGKLVVIVDVVDQNRALVDAPDMVRSQMNFKRLSLTDITIDIKRAPTKKTLIEAMEKADVKNKWENSSWGRKLIVQKRRAALNDFDRFKLMLAKIKKGGLVRQELAKLKKESSA